MTRPRWDRDWKNAALAVLAYLGASAILIASVIRYRWLPLDF